MIRCNQRLLIDVLRSTHKQRRRPSLEEVEVRETSAVRADTSM